MESIRESGDIEQDAHNVVILNNNYAEVVKAREGCESSHKMTINTVKQFVFWETSEEYGPTPEDDYKTNGRERNTVEKKTKNNPFHIITEAYKKDLIEDNKSGKQIV